jgi:hypothetical protein
MPDLTYKILERRQKTQTGTYAFLCVFLLVAVGYYSYNNWQQYTEFKTGYEQNQKTISTLRDSVKDEKSDFDYAKPGFDNLNDEISKRLATVFPVDDDYTNLTREIDNYELTLAKKNDPFEIANIDFQSVIETDSYNVLPLRMNIRSSRDNFTKFLHVVENSGVLDSDVRLMDISSVRLNFESTSDDESGPEIINFSVQINAYYQK